MTAPNDLLTLDLLACASYTPAEVYPASAKACDRKPKTLLGPTTILPLSPSSTLFIPHLGCSAFTVPLSPPLKTHRP
jgi:hypothetical protein